MRSCFPWFPISTYHRGIAKADIFLEVTHISGAKSMWAHFMTVRCHPTLLKRAGQLNSRDINIIKHCCTMVMQVNWNDVLIVDHMNQAICLPSIGQVSFWSSSDLFETNKSEQYHIRILGRVLDQLYNIPLDPNLPVPQHQGGTAETSFIDYVPPYEP